MPMDDLFRNIDPPSGGLECLRRKIAQREVRAKSVRRVTAITIAVLCVCVSYVSVNAVLQMRTRQTDFFSKMLNDRGNPTLLRYGIGEPPNQAFTIRDEDKSAMMAFRATSTSNVDFYWVSSMLE